MIRDNIDCPYLHDVFDQYCNLFKGYKNCDKCDCEVLKTLKENEQLKQENEKLKLINKKLQCCMNCKKYRILESQVPLSCLKNRIMGLCEEWELAEWQE